VSTNTALDQLFVKTRAENRAALIAYIPAGFPTQAGCHKVIETLAKAGVDAIEIGYPYSDPVMDGPTIQAAATQALENGTGVTEVFAALKHASDQGVAAVVMTYWNPIERYGVTKFAQSIADNGGSEVITPDLTIEESQDWQNESTNNSINRIYVVAPSTTDQRLADVTAKCSGFIYAASLMGVTGTRDAVSGNARSLVERIRKVSKTPVAVGLGVSTKTQAQEVAQYADGVIVGSAFIKIIQEHGSGRNGLKKVKQLAKSLSEGVRNAS
jgi:tryptophan synthase alpha chain